ncbi:MAG: response regulator transcription factor [Rhodocyclaceae bacterium]|nr:response regulator transcription factor [Rhodocyclaceae bacterium]MBX3668814.1 response regulator transcription factor [Rhodocyclaceae bacterium]
MVHLVDDDADVARLILHTLSDFGFATYWSRNGAELRRELSRRVPDLCIVDLGLPDVDGMDLVRELRKNCACGVLILTGRAHTSDRVTGLELGADDYVVKPFEPRELVARVRSILRRMSKSEDPAEAVRRVAQFAGWTFHFDSNMLVGPDGVETALSTAEAHLLHVFLDHPNRILTREKLLGERDLSPYDRSIDVRISRLRRKLEADPQNPKLIKTVYGAGYLFASAVSWK